MWQPPTAAFAAAVAVARGGDQAAPIARITGSAEPGPRVLTNPNDPGKNFYVDPATAYKGVLIGAPVCGLFVAALGCVLAFLLGRHNPTILGRWVRALGL